MLTPTKRELLQRLGLRSRYQFGVRRNAEEGLWCHEVCYGEREDPAVYDFGCKRGVQRYNGMLKSHRIVRNLVSWLVELTPSDMGLRK